MKHILLFISLLCISYFGYSVKSLEFIRLNSNNGLSSEEIRDIYQDSEGYMWFLTREGLNRYDGYENKIFIPGIDNLNFTTSSFECICEDNMNRLWLGSSEKGLMVFDKNDQIVTSFEELSEGHTIADLHIRSLMADSQNNIWIGTENGLYRYNYISNKIHFYNLGDLTNDQPQWCIIESLLEDDKGNVWVATWNMGLFIYSQKENSFQNFYVFDENPNTENANRIKSLYQDKDGNIWIGTWEDGLYCIDYSNEAINTKKVFLYDSDNPSTISGDIIYSICQDYNSNIWVGTPYGLTIIENALSTSPNINRFTFDYNYDKGLSNNEVWKIFSDASGLMWLGTLEGGINKVHPEGKIFDGFSIPPVSTQIQSQSVQSFCIDPEDKLLIGIKSLGFGIYDLSTQNFTHYTDIDGYKNLPSDINTVNSMLIEDERFMWLGTRYSGLLIFDQQSGNHVVIDQGWENFTYESILTLYQSDNYIWVGTEDGLYRISRMDDKLESFEIYRVPGLSGNQITTILEDSSGFIWIGTAESGMNKLTFNNGKLVSNTIYQKSDLTIPTNGIHHIFQDSYGKIWVGSNDSGLLTYEPNTNTFTKVDILKDSKSDAVFAIIEDEKLNLWVTTNNGLTRILRDDEIYITDNYTVTDGLQGNIFLPRSMMIYQDKIFAGCYFGFNSFNPSEIKPYAYVPKTTITEVLINQSPFIKKSSNSPIQLKHYENNITFRFSAMSFYKSQKNVFSYKIEGYNDTWQTLEAPFRSVYLTNLQAGEYKFLLQSSNSSGLWNREPVQYDFEIKPAPYNTWWAYTLYSLFFLFILIQIYRYLLKTQKIKQALEIEKIEHAKSEKVNQFKLKFFTNISHELLTPLSVMSCAIENIVIKSRKNKEEISIIERNIRNLERLLQQLLDFRKIETGNLKLLVKKRNFQSHIDKEVDNFQLLARKKNIMLNFIQEGEKTAGYFDPDKIDKILHNIISNAIKYTPDGGAVVVKSSIIKKDEELWAELRVSDTGKGIPGKDIEKVFNRFYRSQSDQEESGFGIGLAVTRNLIEQHKGTIKVKSSENKGTTFIISLPLSRELYDSAEIETVEKEETITSEEQEINPSIQAQVVHTSGDKLNLLIVDDNSDFRTVLKTYFKDKFNVMEAEDGERAYSMAVEFQPDVIVSDVMMPLINGYELCTKLKNNVDTKYIPVILLTAKKMEEEKAKGYQVGADSYITKPVSLNVLYSRINALLIKRLEYLPFRKIEVIPKARFPKLSSEEFVIKVKDYIQQNISDSELQVSDLCQHLGMSNSMLYRKVKQHMNISPVDLLKKMRLNHAATLLKRGQQNISEIAFQSGFSDQSYFTVCFKKEFGITPSDYISKQVEKNSVNM